jgi:hypothetical protein
LDFPSPVLQAPLIALPTTVFGGRLFRPFLPKSPLPE